jgi:hypothetical protein
MPTTSRRISVVSRHRSRRRSSERKSGRSTSAALHEQVALTGHVAADTRIVDVAGVMREITDVQAEHEAKLRYRAQIREGY